MGLHDRCFKDQIAAFPREAVQFFAPGFAEKIPPDAVYTLMRQETDSQKFGGETQILDVPVKVSWGDEEDKLILFIFEEETTGSVDSVMKAAMYAIANARKEKTMRVVPVLIYPFRKQNIPHTFELAVDGEVFVSAKCAFVSLPQLDAEQYLASDNIIARINLPLMKYAPENKVLVVEESVKGLFDLVDDPNLLRLFWDQIDFYSDLDKSTWTALNERALKDGRQNIVTYFQTLLKEQLEKGTELGIAKGTELGIAKGTALGIAKGTEIGIAKGAALGRAQFVLELMKTGMMTPKSARAQLKMLRKRSPEDAEAADQVLAQIGNKK